MRSAPESIRDRIFEHILRQPGVTIQELADGAAVTRTAAVHHIRHLKKDGRISSARRGRRVHHFPTSVHRPQQRSLLATVRLANARAVLETLAEEPEISWRRLAQDLGVTRKTVRWHIQEMEREGLLVVRRIRGGGSHVVDLHHEVEAWLAETRQRIDAVAVEYA